jgi:hypothetical protein
LSQQFWDSLKVIGPVGIFIVLLALVIMKYGPNFIKAIRNGRSFSTGSTKATAGEETTESWILRIEDSTRKVLNEFFEGRDIHIQEVFSKELDVFFTRLKDHLAIVAKQKELDLKSEELEELRRQQKSHKPN